MPAALHLPKVPVLRPLVELRTWLRTTAAHLRSARQYGPLARATVALDIMADCLAERAADARLAHAAETQDREALAILDDILADGIVTPEEILLLLHARALVARSAEQDHDLADRATLPT
jgi:hypothetical protein